MKRKPLSAFFVLILVVILVCCPSIMAQESAAPRTIGKIVRFDDRANELISPDAEIELLASGFEWSEGPLWVQDADGGYLLFSDPPYGLPQQHRDPRRELDFCGVFCLSTSGQVTLLTKEMTRPNGIAFSPDEAILYVAQSDFSNAIIKAFGVKSDGTLAPGKVLYDFTELMGKYPGSPDGLKVDRQGNLFATGPGGVYIITAAGKLLARIHTGKRTSNCAWGGDGSVLYMTVDDYLCRVKTKTRGAAQPGR